jgi:hypothetical protein
MALTVGLTGDWLGSQGNKRTSHGTLTFDSSYPTGGEPLTAANVGLGVIESIQFNPVSGYTFEYDHANEKVLVYVGSGGVAAHDHDLRIMGGQAAATTNVAAHYATDILGKEAATDAVIAGSAQATKGGVVPNTASASGSGAEVTAAEDLSSVVVEFFAVGR